MIERASQPIHVFLTVSQRNLLVDEPHDAVPYAGTDSSFKSLGTLIRHHGLVALENQQQQQQQKQCHLRQPCVHAFCDDLRQHPATPEKMAPCKIANLGYELGFDKPVDVSFEPTCYF
ncbi:hypothetical protein OUZ56_008306 [Daphnia magna]|uniref:Uncharacterized protein n=1 Tax=Daphnia magna TaxID=35525 RepID=A0ABR0ACM4_9CRUS|nr:hypothetical protein OUZ56_008306 [Daphnia magna]